MDERYIDTPQALIELCALLHESPWIALDTEFIREKTYYPRLCLIQIANEETLACVDPLALDDLKPLLDVLCDSSILKVLHSAHQDLEIFFHLRGAVPSPVFDTQIAAARLGYGEHLSYATLVEKRLGIALDKSQTRSDWSRRPLNPAQLHYATDDVRYLRQVYRRLRAELENRGELAPLTKDCEPLCDPDRYRVQPHQAWRRIKAARRLQGMQRSVLRALAAWRENHAATVDRPRRWILRDETLLELARRMPADPESLRQIRGLDPSRLQQHGEILLGLIATARAGRE